MIENFGLEGLVLFALLLGVYASTHVFKKPTDLKPSLQQKGKLASTIHAEMDTQMTSLRVNQTFRHNIPPASDNIHKIGVQVLVFRKRRINTRIGAWLGPFTIRGVDMDRKLVYVVQKRKRVLKLSVYHK